MELSRKHAIIIGLSFFGAMAAYLIGSSLIDPHLSSGEIAQISEGEKIVYQFGMVGEFLNIIFVATMGWLLFKAFRRKHSFAAVSYLVGRSGEVIFLLVSLVFASLIISTTAGHADLMNYADIYFKTFSIAMIALGVGGAILAVALFQGQYITRWIAILGIIGYPMLAAFGLIGALGIEAPGWLLVPGSAFELIFPIWLLWKGGKPVKKKAARS